MRLNVIFLLLVWILVGVSTAFSQHNTYFNQQPVWKIDTQNAHEYPCVRNMNRNQFLGVPVTYDTLVYYPVFERYVLNFGWESDQEPYPHCNGMQTVDSVFKGYVRSFGKRVFFRTSWSTTEHLLYDFDLSVGDTLPFGPLLYYDVLTVTHVDSIQVSNGTYLRVFTLEGNNYVDQLIEGVGSSAGFLEALEKPYNVNHTLQCYSQNGQHYFSGTESSDCIFYLDLDRQEHSGVAAFPNPFSEVLHIPAGMGSTYSYRVRALNGMLVAQGISDAQQELQISTQSWIPGVYFFEYSRGNGVYSMQKLIKL